MNNTFNTSKIIGMALLGLLISSCRGTLSEKPAIHPQLNMDQQDRKETARDKYVL